MNTSNNELVLPALRGVMGNWVYFSCLMPLTEIAKRVSYAEDIHKNEQLSDLIQRTLKRDRAATIAEYLQTKERFFNSLVIATYAGQPNWYELSNFKATRQAKDLGDLPDTTITSIGFLKLRGDERLFALDGQHRLAGIKKAVLSAAQQDPPDELSVIFVSHEATKKGLERTRRLFTTLNKTARPVAKGDIIALDEDDAMAICVRRLIEDTNLFEEKRLAFVANNNLPASNVESLTTIGNLYDVLTLLFTAVKTPLKRPKAELQRVRPSDSKLDEYFALAKSYFALLRKHFFELQEFFGATNYAGVVQQHRGPHGGLVTFRPIGLTVFARVIAQLSQSQSLAASVALASKLPRDLSKAPYRGLMWDTKKRIITNAHLATLREVLLYMLDVSAKWKPDTLRERYRRESGNETAQLPSKLV